MSRSTPPNSFPVVIVEDRYGGTYSGGAWLAIANADERQDEMQRVSWILEFGPHGGDCEAAEFWGSPPHWIAAGMTPDEAVDALTRKLS